MNKIIIQPASGPEPREHFKKTIDKGVRLDEISGYLGSKEIEQLKFIYGGSQIFIWGVVPGDNDRNVSKWEKIKVNDVVLFYQQDFLKLMAQVILKIHNEALAEYLWGRNKEGQTWEYIYFLNNKTKIMINRDKLNNILGYSKNYYHYGLNVLDHKKTNKLCSNYPVINDFLEEVKEGMPKIAPGDIINFEEFKKIHKNTNVGIYVKDKIARSIRFDISEHGAYPDRWIEEGKILDYTGQGRIEDGDQKWNIFNLGIRIAHEEQIPVHVFETLPSTTPQKYKYHGEWYVTQFREIYVEEEKRKQLRFSISARPIMDTKKGVRDVSVNPTVDPDESSVDTDEPPIRVQAKTIRIIRDTKKSRELKEFYNHKCQVCSKQLYKAEDSFYSEAHHLRPLGGDHKGLDSKKNMLVLCPNHHALFDYGVIAVDLDDMKIKHINPKAEENRFELEFSHRIDIENLKYHFENIFKDSR